MKELKGSKTEANLKTAFSGESEARNKYTYFASVAKKEGYQQIAAIFEETAANEKEHAKMWFKELGGLGTTAENLLSAAEQRRGALAAHAVQSFDGGSICFERQQRRDQGRDAVAQRTRQIVARKFTGRPAARGE